MPSEAVWNEAVWFFISTAPITPACNSSATAPRLDDQASVRGDRLAKNSETRAGDAGRHRRLAHGLSIDRCEQLLHGARGRRPEALVETNGLGVFLADHGILPGKLRIARERFVDTARVAGVQRAGRMQWQQHLDFAGLLIQHFFARCHHGQPRSMPAAFSSSANFLRA